MSLREKVEQRFAGHPEYLKLALSLVATRPHNRELDLSLEALEVSMFWAEARR